MDNVGRRLLFYSYVHFITTFDSFCMHGPLRSATPFTHLIYVRNNRMKIYFNVIFIPRNYISLFRYNRIYIRFIIYDSHREITLIIPFLTFYSGKEFLLQLISDDCFHDFFAINNTVVSISSIINRFYFISKVIIDSCIKSSVVNRKICHISTNQGGYIPLVN